MTRNGVEYDFNKSCYRSKLDGKIFVFSSRFNKRRFEERAERTKEKFVNQIFAKYGAYPGDTFPALNELYQSVEKRGYLILPGAE